MNEHTFTIDIGTRKIAAFVARRAGEAMEIVAGRIAEHKSRAVRAGQIHDIERVAAMVREIKESLQAETGLELKKVATAIAGRNLKCYRANGEVHLDAVREISAEDIRQAELAAIQSVIGSIGPEIDEYYFVGHTSMRWLIDGEQISHPQGHYAQHLAVEMITTFLPRKVLESLFSVMRRADLEVSYLTLEPIAAAEAVFPQDMRHLPVALVDIGAGTADIALISEGSIQAFGMLPVAGDFITEFICSEYLIEFDEAEKIKRRLGDRARQPGDHAETCTFTDIFGRTVTRTVTELIERVDVAVREQAQKIAAQIREMTAGNGFSARNFAVVLVGGGGLAPLLDRELAAALGIPQARIGVRLPSMMDRYHPAGGTLAPAEVLGPHSAVALGVSSLASEVSTVTLIHVMVNEKKVELFNFKGGELTLLSALVSAGISRQKIYGKPGLARILTVNGERKVFKGGLPRFARVTVNDVPAVLDTPVAEGDRIGFEPAVDGANAAVRARDLMPDVGEFIFNGARRMLPVEVTVDGVAVTPDFEVEDNARVEAKADCSLAAVLARAGIPAESLSSAKITVDVLGRQVEKPARNFALVHNGEEVRDPKAFPGITVMAGDSVEFKAIDPTLLVGDLLSLPQQGRELKIKINEEEFVFPGSAGKILLNGKEVGEDAEVKDGDILRTVAGRDAEAVLVDIFKYVSVEPQDTVGKRLKLLVNQEEANFTTPLTYGADVRVSFE